MRIALFLTLALTASSAALAQGRPELSGRWLLNYERSGRGVTGNSPDVVFPSELTVTQSPTELSVRRASVRQAPFSAVYKLDGSRIKVDAPAGITETAEAKFDGATLVISYRRSYSSPAGDVVTDYREDWTVSGTVLTVKKTVTQEGEAQSETAAYDKAP
jgi:hypothetical protein